ncbi:MAG: hypothetical protein AB7U73_07880 [Pirellulales bacterium]
MKAPRLKFMILLAVCALPWLAGCGKSYERVPEGPNPMNDKAALIADLSSKDQGARGIAAGRLGQMGAEAQDALPALEAAVKKEKKPAVKTMMESAIKQIKGG